MDMAYPTALCFADCHLDVFTFMPEGILSYDNEDRSIHR